MKGSKDTHTHTNGPVDASRKSLRLPLFVKLGLDSLAFGHWVVCRIVNLLYVHEFEYTEC